MAIDTEKYNGLNKKGYDTIQAIRDMAGQGLTRKSAYDLRKALENIYHMSINALGKEY